MKKLLICFATILSTLTVCGQNDLEAKKLLEQVSKRYNGYKTIQSDFQIVIQDANNQTFSEVGVMYFNKPKQQYAILLKEQEIFSDGKSVWNIAKDIKEVQVTEAESNENTIGPNNLFTFYQSGYKYKMLEDEKLSIRGSNEVLKVVELSPVDTKTNYFKIKLRVNKNGHIHDVSILDKSNNQYTYIINSLYLGKKLSNSFFTFDKSKHPGFEIIDLR